MRVSISEAESLLDELVDRALAGDEIILTEDGKDVARLEPIQAVPAASEFQEAL